MNQADEQFSFSLRKDHCHHGRGVDDDQLGALATH